MAKYSLTEKDLIYLEKLIEVSKDIKRIYDKLIILETLGLDFAKEYLDLLKKLKKLLNYEESLYKQVENEFDKIKEMLDYLLEYNPYNIINIINNIRENKEESIIRSRIITRLNYNYMFSALYTENYNFGDEYLDIYEDFDIGDEDFDMCSSFMEYDDRDFYEKGLEQLEKERNAYYLSYLNLEAESDILRTILKVLDEYLYTGEYFNIRKYLVSFKYLIFYSFNSLEEYFIKNKFEINEELYLSAQGVIDLNNGDEKDLEAINVNVASDLLLKQNNTLTTLIFEDLNEQNNLANAVISQVIIRACLLFTDDELADNFKEILNNTFNDFQINDEKINEIITFALNNREKDKEAAKLVRYKFPEIFDNLY